MNVKHIFYIFIYILFIGCESPIVCDDCYLSLSAPNLEIDNNGYYHMEFLNGDIQTFTTLDADIGLSYEKIEWATNKVYNIQYMGTDNWTMLVNTSSYSDDEGKAHTVLGVWPEFIGDTIKVYCGYQDNCQTVYIDSMEVIIKQ